MAKQTDGSAEQEILEYLTQQKPLTRSQLRSLQQHLNAKGYDAGAVDGRMGKDTSAAIAKFLKINPETALSLSNNISSALNKYGQAEALKTIIQSAPLPPLKELLTQKQPLNDNQIIALQEHLKISGHFEGQTFANIGPKTSSALIGYITENPDTLLEVSAGLLRKIIERDSEGTIQKIAQIIPGFNERIHEQLKEMGAEENTHQALNSSTDHNAVYDLQTLLHLGGHEPGGFDGIIGSKTLGAVERFAEKSGMLAMRQRKPEDPERPNKARKTELAGAKSETPQGPEVTQSFKEAADNDRITASHTGFTQTYEGDNGYGVSNMHIERAWSKITGEALPKNHSEYINVGITQNSRPLIVIDLSHGADIIGKKETFETNDHRIDPGAFSNKDKHGNLTKDSLTEVEFADATSTELAKQLHQLGYQVAFTRNPGEQLRVIGSHDKTLTVRPDFAHALAKEIGAPGVLFFSVQANAYAGEKRAHGSRVYIDIDGVNKIDPNAKKLAGSVAREFKLSSRDTKIKHVGDHRITDRFEDRIQENDSMSAAILIEAGFLTDKADTQAMRKIMEYPEEKMSDIARGINNYVQGKLAEQQLKLAERQPESNLADTTPNVPGTGPSS